MTRRSIRCCQLLLLERKNADLILRIYADKFIGTELEGGGRCFPWKRKDDADSLLAKNVDFPAAVLGLARSNGKEGLDRIICNGTDAGVYAVTRNLAWG